MKKGLVLEGCARACVFCVCKHDNSTFRNRANGCADGYGVVGRVCGVNGCNCVSLAIYCNHYEIAYLEMRTLCNLNRSSCGCYGFYYFGGLNDVVESIRTLAYRCAFLKNRTA